ARAIERRKQQARRSRRRTNLAPSQVELNVDEGIRGAFYDPSDAAGFSSLREYARQIDLLYPEWLHVLSNDGRLKGIDEQVFPPRPFDVIQNGTVRIVDDKVMRFLRSEDTGTEVFPLVNNFDGTNWIDISGFLSDPDVRTGFRQEIDQFLASDRYRGLMVDFEDLNLKKAKSGFLSLLSELSQDLHGKGLKLYVSVPAGNPEFPYSESASSSDGLVLMNYDEHYSGPGGTAGPIASQDWFTNNLEDNKKVSPLHKLICGVANYGYDWDRHPKRGRTPAVDIGKSASVQDAWLAARDSEENVDFDGDSLPPHISYLDEKNLRHDI